MFALFGNLKFIIKPFKNSQLINEYNTIEVALYLENITDVKGEYEDLLLT